MEARATSLFWLVPSALSKHTSGAGRGRVRGDEVGNTTKLRQQQTRLCSECSTGVRALRV